MKSVVHPLFHLTSLTIIWRHIRKSSCNIDVYYAVRCIAYNKSNIQFVSIPFVDINCGDRRILTLIFFSVVVE